MAPSLSTDDEALIVCFCAFCVDGEEEEEMNASDFPHLEGVILLACLRGLFVGCFLWVMPQVFLALQCFACNAFQVQQEKKGKKWRCKLCGEGQSFRKIFFRGTSESSLCVLLLHDVHTHTSNTPHKLLLHARCCHSNSCTSVSKGKECRGRVQELNMKRAELDAAPMSVPHTHHMHARTHTLSTCLCVFVCLFLPQHPFFVIISRG